MGFIYALNALNQPWIAILVILVGMAFDVICQRYGISNDAATGVIGAGVGLLTGQALNKLPPPPPPPPPPPQPPPVEPNVPGK